MQIKIKPKSIDAVVSITNSQEIQGMEECVKGTHRDAISPIQAEGNNKGQVSNPFFWVVVMAALSLVFLNVCACLPSPSQVLRGSRVPWGQESWDLVLPHTDWPYADH